jgi:hypothetical protein
MLGTHSTTDLHPHPQWSFQSQRHGREPPGRKGSLQAGEKWLSLHQMAHCVHALGSSALASMPSMVG